MLENISKSKVITWLTWNAVSALFLVGTLTLGAHGQTLTVSPTPNTNYEFFVADGYTAMIGTDGTVTARIVLQRDLLKIPEGYVTTPLPAWSPSGILGSDFGGETLSTTPANAVHYKATGMTYQPDPGQSSLPPYEDAYNYVYPYPGRAVQLSSLRDKGLGTVGMPPVVSPTSDPYIFAFADFLYNSRLARYVTLHGTNLIDGMINGQKVDFGALAKNISVLAEPGKSGVSADPNAIKVPISLDALQKYGQWYVDNYSVTAPNQTPNLAGDGLLQTMTEIHVRWLLEVHFPSTTIPKFPLVGAAFQQATSQNASQTQTTTSNQTTAGASTPQTASNSANSAGSSLGLLFNGVSGASSIIDAPGINTVVGFSILNNGTPSLFGFNAYRVATSNSGTLGQKSSSSGSYLHIIPRVAITEPFGILVAKSQQGHQDYVVGPSYKINDYAVAYVGAGFSAPQGNIRSSPAVGFAIYLKNVLPDTSSKQSQQTTQASNVKASVESVPLAQIAAASKSQAALVLSGSEVTGLYGAPAGDQLVMIYQTPDVSQNNLQISFIKPQRSPTPPNVQYWLDWALTSTPSSTGSSGSAGSGATLINAFYVADQGGVGSITKAFNPDAKAIQDGIAMIAKGTANVSDQPFKSYKAAVMVQPLTLRTC